MSIATDSYTTTPYPPIVSTVYGIVDAAAGILHNMRTASPRVGRKRGVP